MTPMNDAMVLPQREQGSNGERADARKVALVGVSSGIAAGRRLHVKGNAQVEWWTLFTSLDQFDTCLTTDPLRFGDPILFAQVRREFEHVFNHARPPDLDS